MSVSGKERQATYRQRKRDAELHVRKLAEALDEGVVLAEQTVRIVQVNSGSQPNDGSPTGALLADQWDWAQRQRKYIEALKAEAPSFYIAR